MYWSFKKAINLKVLEKRCHNNKRIGFKITKGEPYLSAQCKLLVEVIYFCFHLPIAKSLTHHQGCFQVEQFHQIPKNCRIHQ